MRTVKIPLNTAMKAIAISKQQFLSYYKPKFTKITYNTVDLPHYTC